MISSYHLYSVIIICLHIVKWFQVCLLNITSNISIWFANPVAIEKVAFGSSLAERGKNISNDYPRYDTKPSDGETPVLELCRMWNTPSVRLHLSFLRPRVVITVRVLSDGQIELLNHLLYLKPFNCAPTNDWYYIQLVSDNDA